MTTTVRASLGFVLTALLLLSAGCAVDPPVIAADPVEEGFTETPPQTAEPLADPSLRYTFVARSPDWAGTLNWHLLPDTADLLPERYTVRVTKSAGYAYGEFGVVVGGASDGSFLLFAIDTQGGYRIARKSGAEVTVIVDWSVSASLRVGRGVENALEMRFGEAVSFLLNDTVVHTMTDPALAGGTRGILAYVGSEENETFHTTGVEVSYRITSVGGGE